MRIVKSLGRLGFGMVAVFAVLLTPIMAMADLGALKNASIKMREGQRLSYLSASATAGRSGINLVPDANGMWVINGGTGKLDPTVASSGAGISVIDISEFGPNKIIADDTTYLLNTVTNSLTLANRLVLQGNGKTLDEIWARPQNFAAFPDTNQKDFRVKRLRYTLEGRTFNAIRIQQNVGGFGWTQHTYDLDSGLLIISSKAVNLNGGGVGLATFRITSGRQLPTGFPGINQTFPSGIKSFKTYNWLAKGSGGVFGAGGISGQVAFQWTNMSWASQVVSMKVMVNGKSQGNLQYIAGSPGSPWMNPNFLKVLRSGNVVDSESVFGYKWLVSGVDSSSVSIKYNNKTENITYKYNKNSGDLLSFNVLKSEGIFGSAATISFVSRK